MFHYCVALLRFLLHIIVVHDVPSLLALALVGDEPFTVPALLIGGMEAGRTAEVEQHPRRDAAEVGDVLKHAQVVAVELGLIVLAPTVGLVSSPCCP